MHFKFTGILLLWATCTLANIYHPVLLGNITVPINNMTMNFYIDANHLVLDEEGGYVYIIVRTTLASDYELRVVIISVDLDRGNFTYKTQHSIATLQWEDGLLSLINPFPSVFALSIFYSATNLTTIMAMDVDGNLLLLDHQPSAVNLQSINTPTHSLYGSIYTTPAGMSLNNYPPVYYAFNNKSYTSPLPIPTASNGIIMAVAVVDDFVYSVGGNYSLCQYPFLSLQVNATTRCQSLIRYSEQLDPLNLNNSVFRFTAPPSGTKLVLSIFSVIDKKARYILWNTQDFENTYLLNLNPDLTPWTLTSICVTYNADLMLSSSYDIWYSFALLDISSMTNGEVLSIPSTGSDYYNDPTDLVISYNGRRLVELYFNTDAAPYLQLRSTDISPTLTPTPQTYMSGLPYMQQIITDEVHGGFWCSRSANPIVGFYSMDNNTLQLQWEPINITQDIIDLIDAEYLNFKLQNESKYMLMFGGDQIAIANIHQNAANELQLSLYSSFIFSTCMAIRVAQFVEAETTNLVLIMSQCVTDLWVTVFEATGEAIKDPTPLANISLEGTLQAFVQTLAFPEVNCIFDFLVSQADPTLLFAVAVGDMQNNTNLIEFEYDYSTRGMAVTKNITVELNCRLLQSQTIRGHLWILCATSDDHFILRQIFAPSYSTCCFMDLFNYNITYMDSVPNVIQWWINGNGTRLLIVSGLNFAMYDISMCQCSNTSRQITPTVLYDYVADYTTERGAIYTLEKQYGVVVIGFTLQGQLQLFTDCPSGRHPSELNYCSMCVPGQSGTFCSPCPAGYLCDRYGLSLPYNLCPAGHYCEPGSIQDPPPCDAGTYCPAGITTRNVTDAFNSAKSCAAGFYCPVASTTPTAFACPPFTLSKVAAGSISDCTCISGYYGFGGACILCPSECECSGPTISRCWMPSGFGISDLHNNSIKPLLCPSYSITGGNQCNPNGTAWNGDGDFPCELGYQDRMCGRCDIGYFADGRRCNLCEPYLGWLLPVLYVATAVFIGLYAWFDSSSDSAALKIILFHFQSLFALITSGLEWNSVILHFVRASSGASSLNYMATECIIPGWNLTWTILFTLLTPVLALVLGCLAWCSSRIVAVLPMVKPLEPQVRKQRLMKVTIFVVTLTYFNIATACFNMFACTSYDSRTDVSYLNSYPWVRCSGKQFDIHLLLGVGGFLLEVIGLPVLYLLAVRSHRPRLSESGTMEVLGSLYAIYKPEYYYWECVVISRRLLIAMIITLVPFNSLWLYFGFFIVIQGYASAHNIYNPYAHKMDNALDFTSQLVLLVSLFVGLLMGVNDLQSYNSTLSLILILVNVFFLLFGTFVIGRHYVRRFRGWWNDKGRRHFKTSMKCCTGGYTKIEPQDFSDDTAKSLNSIYGHDSDLD